MKNSITNNQLSNYQFCTTGTTSAPIIHYGTNITIGSGVLTEENGELVWVRPNGSKCVLTGKPNTFKKLYNKLDESA